MVEIVTDNNTFSDILGGEDCKLRRKLSKFEAVGGRKTLTTDRKLRAEIQVLNEAISIIQGIISKKEEMRVKLRKSVK